MQKRGIWTRVVAIVLAALMAISVAAAAITAFAAEAVPATGQNIKHEVDNHCGSRGCLRNSYLRNTAKSQEKVKISVKIFKNAKLFINSTYLCHILLSK